MTGITPTPQPLEDTQGPAGLAEWLWHPPEWFKLAVIGLAVAVFAIAAYRFYQRDADLSWQQHREMQVILATILAVGTGVTVLGEFADQPYWVDVGLGWAVGYGAVLLLQHRSIQRAATRVIPDKQQRIFAGWALLAHGCFVPQLVLGRLLFPYIAMTLTIVAAGGAIHALLRDEIQETTVFKS